MQRRPKRIVATVVRNAEERRLRRPPLRILEAQPPRKREGRNPVERQRIEFAVRGRSRLHRAHRMRMVVDRADRGDVGDECRIDGTLRTGRPGRAKREDGNGNTNRKTCHVDLLRRKATGRGRIRAGANASKWC